MTINRSSIAVSSVCIATGVALVVAGIVGAQRHETPQQTTHSGVITTPDITVAPCQWFTTHATIPAYTRLDVCVSDNGSVVSVPVQ